MLRDHPARLKLVLFDSTLAIAARVMKNHGGQLSILPSPRGAKIKLSFSLLDI
ncbi:hypothetical protein N8919_01730 [Planktomarina temperata]|nr:hypothetical protein [Planktomarina temperata]